MIDGPNMYGYVGGALVNLYDPLGLDDNPIDPLDFRERLNGSPGQWR